MKRLILKLKENLTTKIRHVIQFIMFLIINFGIIEYIFSLDLIDYSILIKILPILNSPRNHLSYGAGFLEYIFFSLTEGTFPFFLVGLLLLILLFSNRFFCGWICPVGAIQDALIGIPTKNKKRVSKETQEFLIKLKTFILILLTIMTVPLAYTFTTNSEFYENYRENLGYMGEKPLGYFSLSEFIFYFLPNLIQEIVKKANFEPLFKDFLTFFIFAFYIIIIIISIWYPRAYCRYLCPFGAFAAQIGRYSFLKLTRSPVRCVGRAQCGKCEKICPKQVRVLDEPFEFFTGKGECNLCMKCMEVCDYMAIELTFG